MQSISSNSLCLIFLICCGSQGNHFPGLPEGQTSVSFMETIVDPSLQELQWWKYVVGLVPYKKNIVLKVCMFVLAIQIINLGRVALSLLNKRAYRINIAHYIHIYYYIYYFYNRCLYC